MTDDKKTSMSEDVYLILREQIIKNKIKPGSQLVEMDISDSLNVSRTPVREALRQLEQEGLVESFPRRGCFVTEISIEDAIELYEVREYLEGLAMKLICLNIRRVDMKSFEDIVDDMRVKLDEEDYDDLYSLHSKWNDLVVEFTTNHYLKSLLVNIYDTINRLRGISLIENRHNEEAYIETKNILEAINDGNEDECEKLAMLHVRNAKSRFIKNIKGSENISR